MIRAAPALAALLLSGCIVGTVVEGAVDVTTTVVGGAVDLTVSAVEAVGRAVD